VVSKRSDPVAALPKPRGFVSLANRLALWTFVPVVSVSLLVAFQLTQRERDHYVASKERAGHMLTELFAASVAPALDFADSDALASSLGMLSQNREVMDAAIWPVTGDKPLAELHPQAKRSTSDRQPGVRLGADHIDLAVLAKNPTGKVLGTAWVRVSLAQENAAFIVARRQFFLLAFVRSAIVTALLFAVLRRAVISPLAALERAAQRLGRGGVVELVDLRRDEVGRLGHAFNHMGRVIREREERIVAVNGRLQGLLDHMRQAIVVFDGDGHLATERSRFAHELFGDASGAHTDIADLLYPVGRSPEVEREAFRTWLAQAGESSPDGFDELSELAPREVKIRPENGGERLFELEFRAVASEDARPRIMLLATDVTSQRHLERSAESREREHQKQLTAMRRLLAGGGQVFVRFLASARERLDATRRELEEQPTLGAEVVENVFRFVHTLRAEARSFDLGSVEQTALELELELAGARHAPADSAVRASVREKLLGGCHELAHELATAEAMFVESSPIGRRVLEQVTVSREDVTALFRRYGARKDELGVLVSRLAARPFGELLSALPDSVERWAIKEGKRVELVVNGRDLLVPADLSERLGGALSHLLRNAVAHGIEPPQYRREQGKPEVGRIEVTCRHDATGVVVVVQDDGAGFDEAALREKSGTFELSGRNAIELAFAAGVSTRDTVDELAGHGVGLGAVRAELRKAHYVVSIGSERGQGVTVLIEPEPPARTEAIHG
jgi:HAMP domain-containing protein/HPt (histidine-containing phosphotransfer) domain-containing protein